MARDGRLSAEELDALLDDAPAPDAGAETSADSGADELVRGPLGGGRDQRLRSTLARHRVACAAVAAVLVAIAAGSWWHASGPPSAVDADIAATVVVQRVDGGDGDLIVTTLALTPSSPDDQLRAIALQGRGLTMPAVTQDGSTVRAVNLASCAALANLTQPDEYTLRVARTGVSGQEVARDLPIAGDGNRRVWSSIVDECVDNAVESMALRYFAASQDGPAYLHAGILNTSVWDLYLYGAVAAVRPRGVVAADQSLAYFGTRNGPVLLPAGDVTQVGLVPQVDGCRRWLGPVAWSAPVATGQPGRPGDLTAFVGPAGVPTGTASVAGHPFNLYPAQRAAVVRALRAPCAAASPPLEATPLID